MIFFLLAAVWVLIRRISESASQRNGSMGQSPFAHSLMGYLLVCLLLALSVLVKFITALIVPFFLLAMTTQQKNWPVRLAQMGGYGFLIGGLVIGLMWPLWPGWDNWAVIQAGGQAGRSLLALLILAFKDVWGINFTFDLFRSLIYLIFGGIYLYYLGKTVVSGQSPGHPEGVWSVVGGQWSVASSQNSEVRSQNLSPLLPPLALRPSGPGVLGTRSPAWVHASFHVLFWYVLMVAPVFHAWYLWWFLPLASLLLPQQRPLITAIVFSMTALLVIPYFETIRVWYPALLQNQLLGHLLGVPLLLIPPVLALAGWRPFLRRAGLLEVKN
jgi:hypothetical protein